MLWMFQRVFFEKGNPKTETFKDLTLIETLTILPIIILIIFMGIFPQPFIRKITPAAEQQISKYVAPASTVMQLADNSVSVITSKQEKD
jgi:NADH-quinone oxidoreductase subunit M